VIDGTGESDTLGAACCVGTNEELAVPESDAADDCEAARVVDAVGETVACGECDAATLAVREGAKLAL
jgi:hypothetical protein